MHPTVMEFAGRAVRKYNLNTPGTSVLIVGALDVNGSVSTYFDKCDIVGIDLTDGPGVDHVINAHHLLEPDALEMLFGEHRDGVTRMDFDVIACTEMLEHDDEFWTTLYNISVLLKSGGHLILTARGARRGVEGRQHGESMWEHAYPDDYYRFMPNVVPKLLDLAGCDVLEDLQDTYYPGFLALGQRR